MVAAAIPSDVKWAYLAFTLVFVVGLVTIFARGDWQRAQGLDRLILFGPIFYAAPLAAFATEHFTQTKIIASIVPKWMPWHYFWAYFVGTCFILAALSLVTRIRARLAASLVALTMFLFVALMYIPATLRHPDNRIFGTIALRETSFSGGALAFAAFLSDAWRNRGARIMATVALYFVAIPVLFFSYLQVAHANYVPGVPLDRLTPAYIVGHGFWNYLGGAVYAVAGILLLIGTQTRAAATWLGATVLLIESAVYVPIAVVDRASLDNGLNYMADTLMFCGAVLLLAGATPREHET